MRLMFLVLVANVAMTFKEAMKRRRYFIPLSSTSDNGWTNTEAIAKIESAMFALKTTRTFLKLFKRRRKKL
jgi:hypothetical protein